MAETCTMDIETVKGVKNIFFGGEGVFLTKVTGPGKVYLQSMPLINMVNELRPYFPSGSSDSGGINIKLGD